MLAGEGLEDSCEEALGIEQAGQPEHRGLALVQPVPQEANPAQKVGHPAAEGFQRRVRQVCPQRRNLIVEQGGEHLIQRIREHREALDRPPQLHQGRPHCIQEGVIPPHFMRKHRGQRVGQPSSHRLEGPWAGLRLQQIRGKALADLPGPLQHDLLWGGRNNRGGGRRDPRLQRQHCGEQQGALAGLEAQVGVLVHPKGLGLVVGGQSLDKVAVGLQSGGRRGGGVSAVQGVRKGWIQHLWAEEALEDAQQGAAVPAVGDPPSVVNLANHIVQGVPRHGGVLLQEKPQPNRRDLEVCVVELVLDVPAQGPELLAFLDHAVEEAQGVQQLAIGERPGARGR
eukprot:RCo027690